MKAHAEDFTFTRTSGSGWKVLHPFAQITNIPERLIVKGWAPDVATK